MDGSTDNFGKIMAALVLTSADYLDCMEEVGAYLEIIVCTQREQTCTAQALHALYHLMWVEDS